ncbi:hypothetical protein EUTSA_v10008596mg [Eutrema salsugineum]|uniref:Uncharacterized protein n=1 Tax=Eutrema salsugineum TaxID=72664 RepID=V4L2D6_EUTSA|nr:uncharacterized protein LOC18992142 [Eutrema salsugineum]ESQ33918.1 hypothetical protein EUTSA_v10008596mg [Eutrema salsugineum]
MPSGAKKRKALKKKKQQEAIGTSTNNKGFNGVNLHGHDEHGSQDERESDGNVSSAGSQGNEECGTKDPSASLSSGPVKGSAKETSRDANVIAVERGTDCQKSLARNSSSENSAHNAKNVACQDTYGKTVLQITPVVGSVEPAASVSKVVISEKSKHVETSTHSNLVKQKSEKDEKHPSPSLGKDNSKVVTLPGSAVGTSKKVENVRESEVTVSSEEKRLLLPGPPAVRTSWLSCCGLFDAMTGSDR